MHVNSVRMADAMAGVRTECGLCVWCRGMLASSPHVPTSGTGGEAVGRLGGEHFPEGIDNEGLACGAGPSRTHGRGWRGGRRVEGESSSDSD